MQKYLLLFTYLIFCAHCSAWGFCGDEGTMIMVFTVPRKAPTSVASNVVSWCVDKKKAQKALSKALAECRKNFPVSSGLICTHEPIEFDYKNKSLEDPLPIEDFNHDKF